MTVAIRVRGVSKEYRLGELGGYKTLRESLTGAFSRSGRRRGGGNGSDRGDDKIWAMSARWSTFGSAAACSGDM